MSVWNAGQASELRPGTVEPLWPGYISRGKVALLDGDPEVGKSLLTIDIAARVTRGGPWPDGAALDRPGTCVILSAEDDAADTILPRLTAAGADLARVVVATARDRAARLPDDLPALAELVGDVKADYVVIDPIMAFLPPAVSANLDQCVRQVMTPLAALAARSRSAVQLVRHLTKRGTDRAIYRGQGSVGIVAAARTALLAASHPTEPGLMVLSVAKSNVTRRRPSLGYRIVESAAGQPVIEWAGRVDLTADALLRPPPRAEVVRPRERVVDWLKRELADGPRKSADLYAAAAAAGIPERTLERAKHELGTKAHRHHDYATARSEWYWYDPDSTWPADAPFKKPRELRPLEPL